MGAGIGGIVAANDLRKLSAKDDRIILVDRSPIHVFAPSLLWLTVGTRSPESIQKPLSALLRRGIEFVHGNIESIDPLKHTVTVNGRSIDADTIVIALGAELAPNEVPGLTDAGCNFYTLERARQLRDALRRFDGGRIVLMMSRPLYKCPAAPYELAFLIEDRLRKTGLRDKTTIEMVAAEPAPMGVAGPSVSEAIKAMLRSRGIALSSNRQVTAVDSASRLITFADGDSVAYDLLAYVPPHRAPRLVTACGLTNETGWIPVDRATLETSFKDAYAIGDVATIALAMGKPLPKAGVFAHAQAAVVARNISAAWRGYPRTATFNGRGACFVETGADRAAIGFGDFFAEPTPRVTLKPPSLWWHLAKVLFEARWLKRLPI